MGHLAANVDSRAAHPDRQDRPELRVDVGAQDNKNADVADDAGEVGFFSPHSWQPLSLALGGALAFLSVAIGWWLMYFSAPLILVGIWGWVFEYYRGENRTQ